MTWKSQIPMSKNEKFYQLRQDFNETKREMDQSGAEAEKRCRFDFRGRVFPFMFFFFSYFLLIPN